MESEKEIEKIKTNKHSHLHFVISITYNLFGNSKAVGNSFVLKIEFCILKFIQLARD